MRRHAPGKLNENGSADWPAGRTFNDLLLAHVRLQIDLVKGGAKQQPCYASSAGRLALPAIHRRHDVGVWMGVGVWLATLLPSTSSGIFCNSGSSSSCQTQHNLSKPQGTAQDGVF